MRTMDLRALYNRCDPAEALNPDDSRNVDLDALGTPGRLVRGVHWVARLARRIELASGPVTLLFTGLRGSGKSTELNRLAARLSRRDGAAMLTVTVNAEAVLDLHNPIDVPDLIAAVLVETERAVLQAEGGDPNRALQEPWLPRFTAWLARTDVELRGMGLSVGDKNLAGANLVMEMKTRPALRARVRQIVTAHLSTFLRDAQQEFGKLRERAQGAGWKGLVVIVDSLEKLRGTTSNWSQVVESAERVFVGGAPYLRLPVHVVWTVPPAMLSRRVDHVEFMPMIKLRERHGGPFAPGEDAARALIERRIPRELLSEILGPTSVDDRVRRLIAWSGGYPREIVRLLQATVVASDGALAEHAFNRIFNELADEYRKVVPTAMFPWLAKVAQEHYLTLEDPSQQQAADLMLSNNVVLRYLNDRDWFDLHPAVREIPGLRELIARTRTAETATLAPVR